MPEKIWYREPQWISAIITIFALAIGTIWSQATGDAQTRQNTSEIIQLRADYKSLPTDIASIRQAQDDQRELLRHMSNQLDQIRPGK